MLARGALELLWDSCYEAGDDYVGTTEDIEHAVGWSGEAGMLTRALAEAGAPLGVGFIERIDGAGEPAFRVHDLWHHAPDYVAKRRKREMDRQGKTDPSPPNGAVLRRDSTCQDGDVRPPSPSHSPSHSPGKNGEAVFLVFPIVGKGTGGWALSDAQIEEWESLFPSLDIRAEARKALAWVTATPGRRKTSGGMARFLVGWLTRTTNGGGERRSEDRGSSNRQMPDFDATCPHTPPCGSPGNWQCHQRTVLETARKAKAS